MNNTPIPILLLLCWSIFCPNATNAQYFEQNLQPGFYNKTLALTYDSLSGDLLWTSLQDGRDVLVHRLDTAGNLQTTTSVNDIPLFSDPPEILVFPTGYVITTNYIGCDIAPPRILRLVNTAGVPQWETTLPYTPTDDCRLLPASGSSFWVCQPNLSPLLFQLDGSNTETNKPPLPMYDGYLPFPDGSRLIYGDFGLRRYSNALDELDSALTDQHVVKATKLPHGGIVALTSSGVIFYLLADWSIALTFDLESPGDTPPDMANDGSKTWVLFPENKLFQLDSMLEVKKVINLSATTNFQAKRILAFPNKLVFAGAETPTNLSFQAQVLALKTMHPDSIQFGNNPPDVAITDLISAPPTASLYAQMYQSTYQIKYGNVSVVVKNEGNAPVDQVTINMSLGYYEDFCPLLSAVQKTVSGLALAPGDSKTIALGALKAYTIQPYQSPPVPPKGHRLCAWTTLPDNHLDAVIGNNRTCADFTVTDIDEPYANAPCRITPNPTDGLFRVEWPSIGTDDTAQMRLFDVTGRLVTEQTIAANPFTVGGTALPAGLYLVEVRRGDGRVFLGRVVKD